MKTPQVYFFVALAGLILAVGTALLPAGTDTTPPEAISIVAEDHGPTNADTLDIQIVFSEPVTNFDTSDVVIGHVQMMTSHTGLALANGPTSFTLTVSGIAGNGLFRVSVSTSSDVEDPAGNPLASSVESDRIFIDNDPPNVDPNNPLELSPGQPNPAFSLPVIFDVTFSENMIFPESAVDLSGSTVGGSISANIDPLSRSGHSYRIFVNGTITTEGTIIVLLKPEMITDLAGNPLDESLVFSSIFFDPDASLSEWGLYD